MLGSHPPRITIDPRQVDSAGHVRQITNKIKARRAGDVPTWIHVVMLGLCRNYQVHCLRRH